VLQLANCSAWQMWIMVSCRALKLQYIHVCDGFLSSEKEILQLINPTQILVVVDLDDFDSLQSSPYHCSTLINFASWVCGSWIFRQIEPGLHRYIMYQPRLGLTEDSRTSNSGGKTAPSARGQEKIKKHWF